MAEKTMQKSENKLSLSIRFQQQVLKEFTNNIGQIRVTDYQKQILQGYFIRIDRTLTNSEEERVRKNDANRDHKYDNLLPYSWSNVNVRDLCMDVVHYAQLGLDMMQDNFLFPIPYKNNKENCYDITLMIGYMGKRYIALKYALDKPTNVTVEIVHKADTFKPIMKSRSNPVESYEFDIENPFDRGEIIGAFGYIEYEDPKKNELVMMSMADILKRKPKYASANFWGGSLKVWKKEKQIEEQKEGWLEEMCQKTMMREVYSPKHILIDPKKIDDSYQYMKQQEQRLNAANDEVQQAIEIEANSVPFEEPEQQLAQGLTGISQEQSIPVPSESVPNLTENMQKNSRKNTHSSQNVRNSTKKTTNPELPPATEPFDEIDRMGDDMFKDTEDMNEAAGRADLAPDPVGGPTF
ncbi:recombinase RecT [Megasphaera sueciensis]|uniref:recombinase RecT n=1 Tax=Megasphaera sueciensis TaxID=349094 RepID=UPI003D069CDF